MQNSLELFNQQGERSISTNHIAAHMEISPGNLYYHFPNKQAIIAVLFSEYESPGRQLSAPAAGARRDGRRQAFLSQGIAVGDVALPFSAPRS